MKKNVIMIWMIFMVKEKEVKSWRMKTNHMVKLNLSKRLRLIGHLAFVNINNNYNKFSNKEKKNL